MRTNTMPVLSTGHLDEQTAAILTELGDANPWVACAEWEYGYFLYLDEPDESAPKCLHDIAAWLRTHGYSDCWVRLDCDGDKADDLPLYDW